MPVLGGKEAKGDTQEPKEQVQVGEEVEPVHVPQPLDTRAGV